MKPVHELLRENIELWEAQGRRVLTFPEPKLNDKPAKH